MLPGVISLLQLQPASQLMDHLGQGSRIRKQNKEGATKTSAVLCKLVRLPPEPRALPSLVYPAHQAHLPADQIDDLDDDHDLDIGGDNDRDQHEDAPPHQCSLRGGKRRFSP